MPGERRSWLAQRFGRAALPLGWYYAITLVLPFANGAALSGNAFVHHALVVLVVPPLLIVALCVVDRAARVLAGACRSGLAAPSSSEDH